MKQPPKLVYTVLFWSNIFVAILNIFALGYTGRLECVVMIAINLGCACLMKVIGKVDE